MAETPGRDPVAGRSLSVLLLVSVFLLMLTVAWSLYDEFFGLRPWRGYQREFIGKYESYLNKQIAAAKKTEEAMTSSPEYKQLLADYNAKRAAADPKDKEIQQQLALI